MKESRRLGAGNCLNPPSYPCMRCPMSPDQLVRCKSWCSNHLVRFIAHLLYSREKYFEYFRVIRTSIDSSTFLLCTSACDSDRSRGWMMREGGARAAFLDAQESAPDSSSLVSTWREHGLVSFLRQWIDSMEGKDGADKSKGAVLVSKGD